MATPTSGKSLLKEPSDFNGDKSEFKEWRRQLFAYIRDPRNRVQSDNERIDIAISYMRGTKVKGWVQNYSDDHFNDTNETWDVSWKDFKDALNAAFLDKGRVQNAQERLEHLQQEKKTAEEFFNEFEILLHDTGYKKDDPYVIRLIEMNVNQKIIDQIYGSRTDRIKKYDDYKNVIISIDNMWKHHQEGKKETMVELWRSGYIHDNDETSCGNTS